VTKPSKKPVARAPAGLTPQPHGGALAPLWTPSHRPKTPSSWHDRKQEVRDALGPDIAASARELLRIVTEGEDDRARLVAIKMHWDLLREASDGVASQMPSIDISRLSAAEQDELAAALATVRRLAAVAQNVIEG